MKFGVLKSQIESVLVESYKNEQLKKDMFIFDELVLKNKNISKLYYLYDELTTNKGLNESIANDFINQSIVVYENTINKIKPSELKEIELWVGHIECENQYKTIDDLFSSSVLNLENKIKSKNVILETVMKSPENKGDVVKVPLKTMVDVANKTIDSYLEKLTESDKVEIKKILSSDESQLTESFFTLKGTILGKLEKLQENEVDDETAQKITETIDKVKNETLNKESYFKLQKLNENL